MATSFGPRFRRITLGLAALAIGLTTAAAPAQAQAPYETAFTGVQRYVDPLPLPPKAKPIVSWGGISYYEMAMREFDAKLHRDLPMVKMWGYDDLATGAGPASPGPLFDTRSKQLNIVKWINDLPTTHLFKLAPQNLVSGGMRMPEVRTTVHLHGGNSPSDSDGFPMDVFTVGGAKADWYPNLQPATTLWYHDHAEGVTRLSVQAGLFGGYIIRDGFEDGLSLPKGKYEIPLIIKDQAIKPIVNGATSLYYPSVDDDPTLDRDFKRPEFFGNIPTVNGKAWPRLDVEPRKYRFRFVNGCNSRVLNMQIIGFTGRAGGVPQNIVGGPAIVQIGTDGGFLPAPAPVTKPLPDGGVDFGTMQLLMSPGERADVVVDFSGLPNGTRLLLVNNAGAPFGNVATTVGTANPIGGDLFATPWDEAQQPDDPILPEIMQFRVTRPGAPDASVVPAALKPFTPYTTTPATIRRTILMEEVADPFDPDQSLLLLLNQNPFISEPVNAEPIDPITGEVVPVGTWNPANPDFYAVPPVPAFGQPLKLGATEIWEFVNVTADVHPIHLHLVEFQILDRIPIDITIDPETGDYTYVEDSPGVPRRLNAQTVSPETNEIGWKDTVRVPPGMVTRVVAKYGDFTGRYVFHCHILEHEDNSMMRQFNVVR